MEIVRILLQKEFFRFCVVGVIAVLIQYITYYLCLLFLNYNIAFAFGYFLSFIVNYLLSTAYTFKTTRSKKNGAGFAISHVINYCLQMLFLNCFILIGIPKALALIPVLAVCVPTNFYIVRFFLKKI